MKDISFGLRMMFVSAIVSVGGLMLNVRIGPCLDRYPLDLTLATIQTACDDVTSAGGGNVFLAAGVSPMWEGTLKVMGGVNLIGAGSPQTVRNEIGRWESSPATIIQTALQGNLIFYNSPWHSKPQRFVGMRIANIHFRNKTMKGTFIYVREGTPNFRIDHCTFEGGSYQTKIISWSTTSPASVGVFDHCNFLGPADYNVYVGARPWSDTWKPKPLGTADAVYVEDSFFQAFRKRTAHPISGMQASHTVFRYNILYSRPGSGDAGIWGTLDAHGAGWDRPKQWPIHGASGWEFYNNTFIADPIPNKGNWRWCAIGMRSGPGVIFNNTFKNLQSAAHFLMDSPAPYCPRGGCPQQVPCGWDTVGRCGMMKVGVFIWNNTFVDMHPGSKYDRYFYIEPSACTSAYVRYDEEIFGYMDGVDGNTGQPKPGYVPYTYPHPIATRRIIPPNHLQPSAD